MLPIVSVLNLISFIFALFIFRHTWQAYKKSNNVSIRNFSLFFLLLGGFMLLMGGPGIFIFDPMYIAWAAAVAHLLLYIGASFIIYLPSKMTLSASNAWLIHFGVILLGLILFIINIIYISPAHIITKNYFYFSLASEPYIIRLIMALGILITGFITIIFFFRQGKKINKLSGSYDQYSIRKFSNRSYIISVGFTLLVVAAMINFAVPQSVWSYVTAGILVWLGWMTLIFSIQK